MLTTEIYMVKIDLAPDIMQYIFDFIENPDKLRNNSALIQLSMKLLGTFWHRDHILSQQPQSPTAKSNYCR